MSKETTGKKSKVEELKNAEKKFHSFVQRRNELNDMARVLREERDMLNESRNELRDKMKQVKKERDDFVLKMKEHKKIRNKLQEEAKKLIEAKQKKKGQVFKNLPLRVEELKADVQMLEYKQETVPMAPGKENELIEKIREKKKEYQNAQKELKKQAKIEIDISDKDNAIDELFKKADEEHEKVMKYHRENQKKHEEYIKLVNELSVSIAEADKKHEEYIKVRNEAQKNHEKASEMRSKVMSIKGERRKHWKEAKQAIKDQNIKARKAVLDKDKLKEHADKSIEDLKKGKKIEL